MREPELKTTTEERRPASHPGVKDGNGRPASIHEASAAEKRKPAPSRAKLAFIAIAIVVLIAVMFAAGYLPRLRRVRALDQAATERQSSIPEVNVVQVKVTPPHSDLLLPGNITPLTEAILNARADGYLKSRYVDFGDRVKAGQILAEIEAPELDQQVQQARAAVEQGQATLSRAQHVLAQATANSNLAEVTAQRWKTLVDKGVVSKQEYDQQAANYEAQRAAAESARSDIRAAEDSIRGSQHNLERLINLQGYKKIVAPFAGIITARNVDIGSLISSNGTTPLFRMAQIDVLRIMVDVPQQNAPFIKVGEQAAVTLQEFPGRKFMGKVSRTANSLDANTRTLPTEVQVPNRDGVLLPNMFAQVNLISAQVIPSILIPGDALIVRSNGTQAAVIESGNHVHLQPVEVGRDYGAEIEVRSGLSAGQYVIVNPNDDVREGAEVSPIQAKPAQPRKR
jgi:RND family efflux transporter MFP subunit